MSVTLAVLVHGPRDERAHRGGEWAGVPDRYRPRLADARLKDLLATFAAVMINGPRAAGKTTTAEHLAADVVRLDQPAQAAAFRADPDAALRSFGQPLLLDEWQEVPEVLGAVKRAVDKESRPGRYLLTGSVRADLESQTPVGSWGSSSRLALLRMTMTPST
jgi:hypothetical protein